MNKKASSIKRGKALLISALCIFSFSKLAHGALGGNVESVEQDARVFSGSHTVNVKAAYTVHQIQMNNKVIKEYVSASGQVFAVSWRGRVHPDLSVLLGSYHAEYAQTTPTRLAFAGTRANARAPSATITSKMRLFKGGHQRDVSGMAYDPNLLPSGVNPEELYK